MLKASKFFAAILAVTSIGVVPKAKADPYMLGFATAFLTSTPVTMFSGKFGSGCSAGSSDMLKLGVERELMAYDAQSGVPSEALASLIEQRRLYMRDLGEDSSELSDGQMIDLLRADLLELVKKLEAEEEENGF